MPNEVPQDFQPTELIERAQHFIYQKYCAGEGGMTRDHLIANTFLHRTWEENYSMMCW
jgi:hypothetical protein